eukprot:TRINITY_DN4169_c0_g1_i1.p1 TRINITY_DN4169_c0_g1~~TRINITY_DN4169_c0_g1_i1.p1  ORF type:complete len:150 (-),score=15.35 TRINITY_DN4169_c0_g1_i1:90-539(-)
MSGFVDDDEVGVVDGKRDNKPHTQKTIENEDDGHRSITHCCTECLRCGLVLIILLLVLHTNPDLRNTKGQDSNGKNRDDVQKQTEPLVVTSSHTIPNPWAVMIEPLDTVVAQTAVRASWGSINIACFTILQLEYDPINSNLFGAVWSWA